jgi:transcriptional regulator with XRE-family HTH domain
MARNPKISEPELARLRELAADGWSQDELAAEFDISRQHVSRLIRGEQRPTLAGLDTEALRDGVSAAVRLFLDDVELGGRDEVLAMLAQALASKLDACVASESAAAAQAVPRLSAQLVDVIERLSGTVREEDALDVLKRRHRARRLAMAVQYAAKNGNGGNG